MEYLFPLSRNLSVESKHETVKKIHSHLYLIFFGQIQHEVDQSLRDKSQQCKENIMPFLHMQ